MTDPFFLDPGTKVEKEEVRKETGESSKGDSSNTVKQVKPFPYRGEVRKKKDDPVDFMEIFGKLEINLPFPQALKLPLFSKFIKEFIVRKTKSNDKIVIGESVSAVNQNQGSPSKRTDPADFHVIRMSKHESAVSSGVLLGRPFLRTAKTIIDVFDGTIYLDYHGEKFTFNINETMKKPLDVEKLHAVDIINPMTSSPKKKLKTLPPGLKYAYLEGNETFHMIINNNLTQEEEGKLLEVLRKNKKAIGWTLSDQVGISPDLCMHHIHLEEGTKAYQDSPRKLNPNMTEEVLKEVLKLLSLGIIYSIPDRVSPVHMVPKKSGIQLVKNEKNELIPTRLVTGWKMCIDYQKLNTATRKDHFP
ncbi:uncharacterized protein LOC121809016 [Salvia splendens]|uniref:uncharacterized protein LOC121809016 n=1 Tax=Salvia splendens TaxID=180675 RepID=UPI001C267480|nr:uncharacterized protein LOC121809016 [Salvia splendens]